VEQHVIDPRTLGAILVNSAVIALAVMRDGRIVSVNPAFRATFQATDGLIGGFPADVVVDGDQRRLADTPAAARTAPARFFGTGWRSGDQPFDVELSMESIMLDDEPLVVAFALRRPREPRLVRGSAPGGQSAPHVRRAQCPPC
jgi:PAS domain-containing protein